MRWHLSKEEEQEIQREDEEFFFESFEKAGFSPKKMDVGGDAKSPDYRLVKNDEEVIVELKSRFGEYPSGRTTTLITDALSKIQYGYDYTLRHFYSKVPPSKAIKDKALIVKKEVQRLPRDVSLPISLRLRHYETDNLYERLSKQNPAARGEYSVLAEQHYSMHGDGDVAITLLGRNDVGYLRCTTVIGSTQDDISIKEKSYFTRALKAAKKQLKPFIGKSAIGIAFFNHTHDSWTYLDVLRLYGDLVVRFSADPKKKDAVLGVGRNRIIREDRKEWLSFICVVDGHDRRQFEIYRNGFAHKQVGEGYFKISCCTVKTIRLSEDGTALMVE